MKIVTVVILLAAIGVACGGSEPASTLTPNPLSTFSSTTVPTSAAHPTSAPTPTSAPSPTPILVPTPTVMPQPNATQVPTPSPIATSTQVPTETPTPTPVPTATPVAGPQSLPLGRPCSDFGNVAFTASPMDVDTIFYIRPMGAISGAHTLPTDHMYIHPGDSEGRRALYSPETYPPPYEVRAPADGHIVGIDTMSGHLRPAREGQSGLIEDYYLEIYHSCTLYTVYIHLNGLAPEILEVTGEFQQGSRWNWNPDTPPIPVRAGQVIGKVTGNFDFSVHNTEVPLDGFVIMSRYGQRKIHTVDPFDYFEEPLRSRLLEKNLRATEPRGGKIDFDIDGRLVGNWFLEGTKGADEQRGLAFVYDYLDPTQIRISVSGISWRRGWGVRGNAPDPADVTLASGLIKYEIMDTGWIVASTGETWSEGPGQPGSELRGVNLDSIGSLLVQMLEDRRIKIEVFLEQPPSQVEGFTSEARIYER